MPVGKIRDTRLCKITARNGIHLHLLNNVAFNPRELFKLAKISLETPGSRGSFQKGGIYHAYKLAARLY